MIATMNTVWDRTTEFLSDNVAALTPIVLLGIFFPLTLIGSLMPLVQSGGAGSEGLVVGVIVLALSLVTSWAGLAVTALAFDPAAGRGPAVQAANRRFLPVLGISLVTMVIVLLLLAPIGIAFAMSGIDMTALAAGRPPAGEAANGAIAFAGLYMLVIALVLFWGYVRFVAMIAPIMIMERRGLGVYGRAFVLTRRIAWKMAGVLILYFVVSWVASAAAKLVFGTLFSLLIGGDGQVSLATVLTQIASAAISTLFSVLAVAFIAKLYLAVRDAREAIIEVS